MELQLPMERASRVVLVLGGVLAWGAGIAYAFWSVAYFCLRDFERGPFWWVCALTLGAYNIYKCAQAGGFLHIPVGISYASRKVFRGSFLAKLRRTLFLFRKARQSWSPLFWLWMPHGILLTPA
jgi:hypothetical protein